MLIAAHGIAAHVTGQAIWEMGGEEASALAVAAGKVARHYDVVTTQKTLDWAALGSAVLMSYGMRVMAIRMAEARPPQPGVVDAAAAGLGPIMGAGVEATTGFVN